jgi:imidazoleglycerol-phosphate dehydratase
MQAQVKRRTRETDITVELKINGSGGYEISTSLPFFDHLLASFAKHGRFDLVLRAQGDHEHHIVEDVAIVLGQAFREAVGSKAGIRRFGHAVVPMDDVLVLVAVDISGRSYCSNSIKFRYKRVEGLSTELIGHFLESFASEFRINLHAKLLDGKNEHHKAEALFKALGIALSMALEKRGDGVPSTKGVL